MRRNLYDENKKIVPNSFELSPDSVVTVRAFTLNRDDYGRIENLLTFLTGEKAYRFLPKDIVKIIKDKKYYVVAFEVKEVAENRVFGSSILVRIYKEKPKGSFKIVDRGYCRYTMKHIGFRQSFASILIDDDVYYMTYCDEDFLDASDRLKRVSDEVMVHFVFGFDGKFAYEGRKIPNHVFLCRLFKTNTRESKTVATYPYRKLMNRLKEILEEERA